MSNNWSEDEVNTIIPVYFDMLLKQLSGEKFVKSHLNERLIPRLNDRSKAAIEYKHSNISAMLNEIGYPYVLGYSPMSNYQNLLLECVIGYIDRHNLNLTIDDIEPVTNLSKPWLSYLVDAPSKEPRSSSKPNKPKKKQIRRGVFLDYSERERKNRELGRKGEEFIIGIEKQRLKSLGIQKKVEWKSKTEGDGLGYDILSWNEDNTERFIEVKTTRRGLKADFYFSRNELEFSKENPENYYLYRVHNFGAQTEFYVLQGCFEDFCEMEEIGFRGRVFK